MEEIELRSCPFCGAGESRFDDVTHWTGQRSILLSVKLRHWCEREEGVIQNIITLHGKTHKEAAAVWNGDKI